MLTPEEHLKILGIFKGFDPATIPTQIDQTMKDVDLVSKAGAYSKNLSGVQKWKLSFGIVLISSSKSVMLDEPTSGMDLTAWRKICEMLKRNKDGKVIILTTHFMDEADILEIE